LTDELDGEKAISAIEALNRAGYIIVPKGAIGRAQDDAVREYVAGNIRKAA